MYQRPHVGIKLRVRFGSLTALRVAHLDRPAQGGLEYGPVTRCAVDCMTETRPSRILTLLGVLASLTAAPRVAAEDADAPPADGENLEPGVGEEGDEGEGPEAPTPPSDLESRVRILQQRPILKAGRFELALAGGASIADVMHDQVSASAVGRFHISESVAVGATWSQYFAQTSEVFDTVTGDLEVYPELSTLRWYAGLEAAFVMLDGKFKLFESGIGYWDLQAFVGGGVTATSRSDALPTAMVGAGLRVFLTRWLALTLEARDHLYVESFAAGSRLVNNVVGQGGLAIFIPFGFDYTFPK
jgi:outer membrane beta-barrel protein